MILLAVDIGNTGTKAALIENGDIVAETDTLLTDDFAKYDNEQIFSSSAELIKNYKPDGLIISSVVKGLGDKYATFCKPLGLDNPLFVSGNLKYRYSFPEEVKNEIGADILATNAACDAIYGDCILVDTGTAITFQILENHIFKGGIICAGLDMSAKALSDGTSLLPKVPLEIPDEFIGFNTIKCIQSGLMYGHAFMIEGMIERIKNTYHKNFKVIATGSKAKILNSLMKNPFDKIENGLIFKGLNIIYNDNYF